MCHYSETEYLNFIKNLMRLCLEGKITDFYYDGENVYIKLLPPVPFIRLEREIYPYFVEVEEEK